MSKIKIIIVGAVGKMGQEVVRAVFAESDLAVVGAVDKSRVGEDIGLVVGKGNIGVAITSDLGGTIKKTSAEGVVDFTHPDAAGGNILTAL